MQRGKHLFVEKPLAPAWLEARELQLLAAKHGAHLQVGIILRYEAAHRCLHSQIQTGAFGELVSFRGQRNCSRQSFAAVADRIHTVHRTLIHDIDLLLWLSASRVTSVMAMDDRQGDHLAPQGCFAMLQLESGCVAHSRESDIADLNSAVEALRVADAIIEACHTNAPVKLSAPSRP